MLGPWKHNIHFWDILKVLWFQSLWPPKKNGRVTKPLNTVSFPVIQRCFVAPKLLEDLVRRRASTSSIAVHLSWAAPYNGGSPILGYIVERKDSPTAAWVQLTTSASVYTSTTYVPWISVGKRPLKSHQETNVFLKSRTRATNHQRHPNSPLKNVQQFIKYPSSQKNHQLNCHNPGFFQITKWFFRWTPPTSRPTVSTSTAFRPSIWSPWGTPCTPPKPPSRPARCPRPPQ